MSLEPDSSHLELLHTSVPPSPLGAETMSCGTSEWGDGDTATEEADNNPTQTQSFSFNKKISTCSILDNRAFSEESILSRARSENQVNMTHISHPYINNQL